MTTLNETRKTITANQRTAEQAYMERRDEVLELLDAIRATVQNHDTVALTDAGEKVHWGHVGDLAEVASLLHRAAQHVGLD